MIDDSLLYIIAHSDIPSRDIEDHVNIASSVQCFHCFHIGTKISNIISLQQIGKIIIPVIFIGKFKLVFINSEYYIQFKTPSFISL